VQLTYLGCVLTPTAEQLLKIQNKIDNFVLKGTPWSKISLYLDPGDGGLGLINISDFFTALKCSWVKRIHKDGINDNWRFSFAKKFFFNPLCFRLTSMDPQRKIEHGIGTAFWKFLINFWKTGKNIMYAPIIKNPLFIRGKLADGRVCTGLLDERIIGIRNYQANEYGWLSLRCCDFFQNNVFKGYNEIVESTNLPLTQVAYMAVRSSITFALKKYRYWYNTANGNGISLEYLMELKNKKSKIFRRWLTAENAVENLGKNLIQKTCELTNCNLPDSESIKSNIGFWNTNFLPVQIKEFALKLSRNSLPVNSRLAARYRANPEVVIDESCRNCKYLTALGPHPRETFFHFFYECQYASILIKKFSDRYFDTFSAEDFKNVLFLGSDREGQFCIILKTISVLFLYEIWAARNSKKIPPGISTIESNMKNSFNVIFAGNREFFRLVCRTNLKLCRTWWPAGHGGRG
jgi:hypothetical protein